MIAGLKRLALQRGQGLGKAVCGFGPPSGAGLRLASPFKIVRRFVAANG